MEKGFFHENIGYWQTTNQPSAEIMATYPSGTVEVPLMPAENHSWDGTKWVELPPDLDTLAASARAQRNGRLTASDWTQVADAPVDKAAWATYRQALRDITTQESFPESVVWPSEPK